MNALNLDLTQSDIAYFYNKENKLCLYPHADWEFPEDYEGLDKALVDEILYGIKSIKHGIYFHKPKMVEMGAGRLYAYGIANVDQYVRAIAIIASK
jgi:hypothetical protein